MDRLEGWEIDALESLVRQYEWSAHDYYSKAYDIEMDSDDAKILEKAIELIKAIPSTYKGMTNREVLEAVFPNIDFCIKEFDGSMWVDMEDIASFRLDWWNSPYNPQESEDEG